MATLRNRRKFAALNKENREKPARNNLAQNWNVPISQEDCINQFSEEIEGRVTMKLSQEFSRTGNRILGAVSHLDEFLMNPLTQGHFGTTPETSQNAHGTNQGMNEVGFQSNPNPEASEFSESDNTELWPRLCFDNKINDFRKILKASHWRKSINIELEK